METIDLTPEAIQAADLLDRIQRLDQMVMFHRNQSGDASMQRQYEAMRRGLEQELIGLLTDLRIPLVPVA